MLVHDAHEEYTRADWSCLLGPPKRGLFLTRAIWWEIPGLYSLTRGRAYAPTLSSKRNRK